MIEYKIVVLNKDKMVIGVHPYDCTNDGQRNARIEAAAKTLAARLGIETAPAIHPNRSTFDAHGNDWGKMSGNIRVGMVEVGWGKWGFPS